MNQGPSNGERYETPLPWKPDCVNLHDNYQICEKKLFALLRRLRNSSKLLREYDEAIRELELEGIIEEVPPHDSIRVTSLLIDLYTQYQFGIIDFSVNDP